MALTVLTDDEIERHTAQAIGAQAPVEVHEPQIENEPQKIDIDVDVPMFDVEVTIDSTNDEIEQGIFFQE